MVQDDHGLKVEQVKGVLLADVRHILIMKIGKLLRSFAWVDT